MNPKQFESLLYEGESATLDYKSEQYPLAGANDHQKSELLKDILAFANAHRRADAYILVGVKEVKGGRCDVPGVTSHLDDADLQQFVNQKLNRRISFSYSAFAFEGTSVGIIHIPMQEERPFFLSHDYGKLRRNIVYTRRGTSTDEATPDETFLMGKRQAEADVKTVAQPTLDLRFIDMNDADSGTTLDIESEVVSVRSPPPPRVNPSNQMEQIMRMHRSTTSGSMFGRSKEEYLRELAEYVEQARLLCGFGVQLKNTSGVLLVEPRLEMTIPRHEELVVCDEYDYPERPREDGSLYSPRMLAMNTPYTPNRVRVYEHPDAWVVSVDFGNVQPQARTTASSDLYLGAREDTQVVVEALVYADNLSAPVRFPVTLNFRTSQVEIAEGDLERTVQDMATED